VDIMACPRCGLKYPETCHTYCKPEYDGCNFIGGDKKCQLPAGHQGPHGYDGHVLGPDGPKPHVPYAPESIGPSLTDRALLADTIRDLIDNRNQPEHKLEPVRVAPRSMLERAVTILILDGQEIIRLRRAIATMQRDLDDANAVRDAAQAASTKDREENRILKGRLERYGDRS
jgi:hypothetical protein